MNSLRPSERNIIIYPFTSSFCITNTLWNRTGEKGLKQYDWVKNALSLITLPRWNFPRSKQNCSIIAKIESHLQSKQITGNSNYQIIIWPNILIEVMGSPPNLTGTGYGICTKLLRNWGGGRAWLKRIRDCAKITLTTYSKTLAVEGRGRRGQNCHIPSSPFPCFLKSKNASKQWPEILPSFLLL